MRPTWHPCAPRFGPFLDPSRRGVQHARPAVVLEVYHVLRGIERVWVTMFVVLDRLHPQMPPKTRAKTDGRGRSASGGIACRPCLVMLLRMVSTLLLAVHSSTPTVLVMYPTQFARRRSNGYIHFPCRMHRDAQSGPPVTRRPCTRRSHRATTRPLTLALLAVYSSTPTVLVMYPTQFARRRSNGHIHFPCRMHRDVQSGPLRPPAPGMGTHCPSAPVPPCPGCP